MAKKIENMTKSQFDGFIMMLEAIDFKQFPLTSTPEGLKTAAQYSLVTILRNDADFDYVYKAYDKYNTFGRERPDSAIGKQVKEELYNLRHECADY